MKKWVYNINNGILLLIVVLILLAGSNKWEGAYMTLLLGQSLIGLYQIIVSFVYLCLKSRRENPLFIHFLMGSGYLFTCLVFLVLEIRVHSIEILVVNVIPWAIALYFTYIYRKALNSVK